MAMLQCQVDFASITLRADGPGCRVILRGGRVNAVPDPTIRPDWCMTDALLLAMHDLRTVLVRKKADRLMKEG